MAKDFRKDIDYMMSYKMGLDDTFQFRCKACGKWTELQRWTKKPAKPAESAAKTGRMCC